MARIKLTPIKPLELEFQDGTIKKALFNNEAYILYEEEFGEMSNLLTGEVERDPYGALSKILYCGLKVIDPQITLEEALQIMYMGGTELAIQVGESLINNFNLKTNEASKKKFLSFLKANLTKEQIQMLKSRNLI